MGGCLQPLGCVPGKALVYHRKVFLCPSHPQLKLEEGCTFSLFSDVGHTGHLPVSVAWEQAAVMHRASRLTEKHCCSSPEGGWSALLPYAAGPSAGKDDNSMALLCLAPGQESVSAQVSARLKHILNVFLNQTYFLMNQDQHEKSANKIN